MGTGGPVSTQAQEQESPAQSREAIKKAIDELHKKLQRAENQRMGGATPLGPKGRMLDVTPIEKADPDNHYRWINSDDAGKVSMRLEEGYVRVERSDLERLKLKDMKTTVGEGILMRIPRPKYEERVSRQKALAESRLKAHRSEVREVVEGVARELRRRGLNIPIERLLVDED